MLHLALMLDVRNNFNYIFIEVSNSNLLCWSRLCAFYILARNKRKYANQKMSTLENVILK